MSDLKVTEAKTNLKDSCTKKKTATLVAGPALL